MSREEEIRSKLKENLFYNREEMCMESIRQIAISLGRIVDILEKNSKDGGNDEQRTE